MANNTNDGLYIGLMSGTSLDGIDAVLVKFDDAKESVVAFHYTPWTQGTKAKLLGLCSPGDNEIDRLGETDIEVADALSDTVATLLHKSSVTAAQVRGIGSHGQTIRHRPDLERPFTLQIGDPNRIAEKTGITVVADFRRRDMAAGGEGAPLAPAYHAARFRSRDENRVALNIGGIANITLLPKVTNAPVIGFDTGPGNTLLDAWIQRHRQADFDAGGKWAAEGSVNVELLADMLSDPYFSRPTPKSTGPEYFNIAWIEQYLPHRKEISPIDVQATLTVLTAQSVATAINAHMVGTDRLIICGGGAHNPVLLEQLRRAMPNTLVESSAALGVDPDQIEALAFAWLARQTLSGLHGNLPAVTGAHHPAILGGIYPAG